MTSTWTPQTHTPQTSRRGRATAIAPVVALILSAGLFVAVLTTGGQPVATAETVAPERVALPTPPVEGTDQTDGPEPSQSPTAQSPSLTAPSLSPTAESQSMTAAPRTQVSTPAVPRQSAARGSASPARTAARPSTQKPSTKATRTAAPAPVTPEASSNPASAATQGISVSLGFDPARALRFANWAGDGARVSTTMLVRMFGAAAVCASGTQADCVAKASAAQLLEEFNSQLAAGRCEGMVAMVGLALESGRDLSGLDRGHADDEIAYWSLSQVAPRVAARAEATRAMTPSRIVTTVAARIAERRTVSLLLWGEGTAHAVLPVAVRQTGSSAEIDLWDPNSPERLGTLVVDTATETWSYADALDANGATVGLRRTGAGGLGLVENDLRTGEHRARFAD